MANGMTRNALAQLQLKNKGGKEEMNEEMIRLSKKMGDKVPLKAGKSGHNHSK